MGSLNEDMDLLCVGGSGELVRLVRLPVTGRSASFRLCFRFVRAVRDVRVGKAKLHGRMYDVVPRWASRELVSMFVCVCVFLVRFSKDVCCYA